MEKEKIHPFQKFMDNIWLLLALGLAIPLLSYTLWGLIELMNIPQGTLP
jgi:FtsH-binding integral membrane protein